MSKTAHKIFIGILAVIVITALISLFFSGLSYYRMNLEERVFHPDHHLLKPSGILGHGLGIMGSLFMIFGVASYMARKRYRSLSRMGLLKHWLEMHIFLCTLGPIMVLFHTAFKFGGIVAVSFWSMVLVFLSGVIGRFIYIQIPRTIEGRELTLQEISEMKDNVTGMIRSSHKLDEESFSIVANALKKKIELHTSNPIIRQIRKYFNDRKSVRKVMHVLKRNHLPKEEYRSVIALIRTEMMLNRRIERLDTMQRLFRYWHVAHLPFALVMLIIMILHVGVTLVFGYRWIF